MKTYTLLLAIVLVVFAVETAAALTPTNWIVQQFSNNSYADLGDTNYCDDRRISGEFLKALLTTTNYPAPTFGVKISRAIITNQLDLRNATVLRDLTMKECRFEDNVLLSGCEFQQGLRLTGCSFSQELDAEEVVVKRSIKFEVETGDTNLFLTNALLPEAVPPQKTGSWVTMDFASNFRAALRPGAVWPAALELGWPAKLLQLDAEGFRWAVWDETNGYIFWRKTNGCQVQRVNTFYGEVSFKLANVTGKFEAADSQFHDEVNMNGLKVGNALWLANTVFWDRACFAYAHIGSQFALTQASFTHTNQEADFYALQVDGLANLNGARFAGPANFIQTTIKGNLEAYGTAFLNQDDLATLSRTSHHNADFGSLHVDGFTFFVGTRFDGEVSFRNAHFQSLFLDEVIWPTNLNRGNSVRLDWMRFDRIRATTNFLSAETNRTDFQWRNNRLETWRNLKPVLAGHAPYSADVYHTIEQFFERDGDEKLARDVFYESKEQERKKILNVQLAQTPAFDLWQKLKAAWQVLWNWVLKFTVGHGKHPEWALLWSAFIILLGCYVFRFEKMDAGGTWEKTDSLPPARHWADQMGEFLRLRSKHHGYHALWYSLVMFVPLIELDGNKGWRPRPDRRSAWNYLFFHRVAGAILIPLGFAAFSGIIK